MNDETVGGFRVPTVCPLVAASCCLLRASCCGIGRINQEGTDCEVRGWADASGGGVDEAGSDETDRSGEEGTMKEAAISMALLAIAINVWTLWSMRKARRRWGGDER